MHFGGRLRLFPVRRYLSQGLGRHGCDLDGRNRIPQGQGGSDSPLTPRRQGHYIFLALSMRIVLIYWDMGSGRGRVETQNWQMGGGQALSFRAPGTTWYRCRIWPKYHCDRHPAPAASGAQRCLG